MQPSLELGSLVITGQKWLKPLNKSSFFSKFSSPHTSLEENRNGGIASHRAQPSAGGWLTTKPHYSLDETWASPFTPVVVISILLFDTDGEMAPPHWAWVMCKRGANTRQTAT